MTDELAAEPDTHRLSRHHFDALAAGGGDAETIAELLVVERSWRKLQLRAVWNETRARPEVTGPLPPVDEAWTLLTEAQRRAPAEVDALLLHPQAGTWAGYLLRRLRGSTIVDAPLWIDVGYLHALAAVAGIRAGLTFTTRVPVRDGFVALPTLGGAYLEPNGSPWTVAEVRGSPAEVTVTVAGTTIRVPGTGTSRDGWVAPPRVEAQTAGYTLSVNLDHLDPYRNLRAPTPPDRLTTEQVERWQTLLVRAWELIATATPGLAGPIAKGLFCVVPQPAAERFRTMSASAGDAFGSTIVSEPEDAPELAVTLVHEFQHIKLGGLLHLAPLHHREPSQRLYAPWRDDPRPLGGLLQGLYAFVGITEFWRAFRHQAGGRTAWLAQFEFARWRQQVWATLEVVRALPELTEVGRQLVAGLVATAEKWRSEPVPAEPLAAANAAVTDHRARWRMHHLRPDAAVVAEYAAAWAAGAGRPAGAYPEPVVDADGSARRLDTRAVLALWRHTDADGFIQLERDPATVGTRISGATPADLAYTAGDLGQAREGYLAELSAEPGSPSAWSGLGLVAAAEGAGGAGAVAATLRDRPELVRAVHQELRATGGQVDPWQLAGWVGTTGDTRAPAGAGEFAGAQRH